MDCDIFVGIDSEKEVLETYREIAKKRGIYKPPDAALPSFNVEMMLPPHQRKRYTELKTKYEMMQLSSHPNTKRQHDYV